MTRRTSDRLRRHLIKAGKARTRIVSGKLAPRDTRRAYAILIAAGNALRRAAGVR